jgi:hypothetical protein
VIDVMDTTSMERWPWLGDIKVIFRSVQGALSTWWLVGTYQMCREETMEEEAAERGRGRNRQQLKF